MRSPVLFLIFKREETTRVVFERIRKMKPQKLYIAADGPRENRPDEYEKCLSTRKIVENVDWPCEVHKLFQDKNLGCGKGVSIAISWFFKHEEQGIIIEDDILPHPDFFEYCDIMLDKYRDDESIQLISGWSPFFDGYLSDNKCYKSSFFHIWGWASWRRVWQTYEFDASKLSKNDFINKISLRVPNSAKDFFVQKFDIMVSHKCDTWDYQLYFNQIIYNRYSIIPFKTVTENIGVGSEDAVHTKSDNNRISNHHAKSILPITQSQVFEDKQADLVFMRNLDWTYKSRIHKIFIKIRNRVLRIL